MIFYENLQKIINDVRIFDRSASEWLEGVLIRCARSDTRHSALRCYDDLVNNVDSLLAWDRTPQGHEFWSNMHKKIKTMPKMNRNGANSG